MAPPAADADLALPTPQLDNKHDLIERLKANNRASTGYIKEPLKYSGSLDQYRSFDVTKVIGREFPDVQLTSILHDDTKIRDLAILGMFESTLPILAELTIHSVSAWCGFLPQSRSIYR